MAASDIQSEIESRRWFHRFELAPGIWSPGTMPIDPSAALNSQGIASDLHGKRVIDIGAADGAYSFEFARRGASVMAVDIQGLESTGFSIANKLAPAPVEHRVLSVYDLSADAVGQFDIAWYWGVYYHLREPLLAFRNIYHILADSGLLCFEGVILDGATGVDPRLAGLQEHLDALRDVPLAYFTSGSFANDRSNWYVPNSACLREWLQASGFKDIKMDIGPKRIRSRGTAVKDSAFIDWEHALTRRPIAAGRPG